MDNTSASQTQEKRIEQFREVVQKANGEFLIIVAQVDPDGIASAMGMAAILRHVRNSPCHVRIVYCGKVGHPQNRAIFNKANLSREMMPAQELKDIRENTTIVLVDSASLKDARLPEKFQSLSPTIIIDHHRGDIMEGAGDTFFWIEDVGAASTLIVELAEATETEFNGHLPLLLALGIYTDTKKFIATTARDRAAYGAMADRVSSDELMKLVNYALPESYYENLQYALAHMEKGLGGRLVANAGTMKSEDGDDLSIIADELLRRDGVTLVIVWGIFVKEKQVRLSARCTDLGTPLDQFLKERFGAASAGAKFTPDGRGEGGALVSLDLGIWMSDTTVEQVEALVHARIKEFVLGD